MHFPHDQQFAQQISQKGDFAFVILGEPTQLPVRVVGGLVFRTSLCFLIRFVSCTFLWVSGVFKDVLLISKAFVQLQGKSSLRGHTWEQEVHQEAQRGRARCCWAFLLHKPAYPSQGDAQWAEFRFCMPELQVSLWVPKVLQEL